MVSALRSATRETLARMPSSYVTVFHACDDLQKGLVDLAFAMSAGRVNVREGLQVAVETFRQSSELLRLLMPGHDAPCDWQEMQNKVRAYQMFQYVDTELGFDQETRVPAVELLRRAASLDDWLAVWAFEGIGNYVACRGDSVPELLRTAPERASIPLHAGLGTALADRIMRRLNVTPDTKDLSRAADEMAFVAESYAMPGLAHAMFEPLGLVTWTLYPHLVKRLGQASGNVGPNYTELFWHGVGRAIYFGPAWFVPCGNAHCKAVAATRDLAPSYEALRNAQAGLAWATTLANVRHPRVLQVLWKQCGGLFEETALRDGIFSALVAWLDMAVLGRGHLNLYMDTSDLLIGEEDWKRLVGSSCALVEGVHNELRRRGKLGDLFRFTGRTEVV